jgi:uncharacterized protein (TIGR02246 family)
MTEASNRNDAKAATRMYAEDADFVTVRGERITGAAAMQQRLAVIFATRGPVTVKPLGVTVRFIRPDVAVAHVTNELSGLVSPDGQPLAPQRELSLRVFERGNGTWRVAVFHNTIVRCPL